MKNLELFEIPISGPNLKKKKEFLTKYPIIVPANILRNY